jgi:hypothetical protein
MTIDKRSEQEIAEEYRRQRQEADGRRSQFARRTVDEQLAWLNNHEMLLSIAIKAGTQPGEAEAAVAKYKAQISAVGEIGPHDDANATLIMRRVLGQIEQACVELEIETSGPVVSGLLPMYGLDAGQKRVPYTDASIVAFSTSFLPFCDLVSVVLAASLVVDGAAGTISCDQRAVSANLEARFEVAELWVSIILDYAVYGWNQSRRDLELTKPEQAARALLLRAMELFAFGHEFAHHALRHDLASTHESSVESHAREYAADQFAQVVSKHIGSKERPPVVYAVSGVGAVVILKALDLISRARSVLETGDDTPRFATSHPPVVDRIQRIAEVHRGETVETQERYSNLRQNFAAIFDRIWLSIRPDIVELHKKGIRPQRGALPAGGWLPFKS